MNNVSFLFPSNGLHEKTFAVEDHTTQNKKQPPLEIFHSQRWLFFYLSKDMKEETMRVKMHINTKVILHLAEHLCHVLLSGS